jgi:hypothetical protein
MAALDPDLAARFRRFAEVECDTSPLYRHLSAALADDPELLALAAPTRHGPVPLLFLGAVHYLLLQGVQHPLSRHYASLGGRMDGDPYPDFRDFCRVHQAALEPLLASQRVQTNEVRRCVHLLPAFNYLARQCPAQPLALIEMGASAGLNLNWDRYSYDYGDGKIYGAVDAPVCLIGAPRGRQIPPYASPMPTIATRIGLDLNPIDVRDPQAALWLRALIWPENVARAALFERAVAVAHQHPPAVVRGDALADLPALWQDAPAEAQLCVFHSFVLNQFALEARERFSALLAEHSTQRRVSVIALEWLGGVAPTLTLTHYDQGQRAETHLAHCHPHGEWLEWEAA